MRIHAYTLGDLLERNASLHGSRPAFVCEGRVVSHAGHAVRVGRLAAGLAREGVAVGERVAVVARNGLAYVEVLGALARLGAIAVPVNGRLAADETAHVLADADARVLVASPDLLPTLAAVRTDARRFVIGAADGAWRALDTLYVDGPVPSAPIGDDAPAVMIHTAAVGGRPRGALLTHRGLIAAAIQSQLAWGLGPTDVNAGVLPLFHVAGLGLLLATQMAGGSTVLMARFDAAALAVSIDERRVSVLGTFPPMLAALLDEAAWRGTPLPSLRVVTGIDSPATIERLHAACPGASFWSTYGQTETSGMVALAPFRDRPGSAGRATALNAIAIVDELDRPLPPDTPGEIVVRGPMVFAGYWRRDADTEATARGGWHHTGDLGRLDDEGCLWYVGRSPVKALIKSGGENVYAAEVERVVGEHPAIAEVAVVGVPDPRWGEAVKAVCVARPGSEVAAGEIAAFVASRIARYKVPRHVVFVDALPKNGLGAIDRVAVAAVHGVAADDT